MNAIAWLIKPRPFPAFVLIAIILIIFAVALAPAVPAVQASLIGVAAALLVSFARGVKQDLELAKVGIVVTVRVTRVEQKKGTYGREPDEVWQVYYTFQDHEGIMHENFMPIEDRDEASKYSAGGTAQLRYHPNNPEIYRWLG